MFVESQLQALRVRIESVSSKKFSSRVSSDGASRVGLGLEGCSSCLGISREVCRPRDFEHCKEMDLYNSTILCLRYLQVRKKNKTRLKNARYLEKDQNRVMTTFFKNFDAQISKSHISVSNFESRI